MGYQPKMPKKKKEKQKEVYVVDLPTMLEIEQHLPVLVLRKSAGKLRQFLDCYKFKMDGSREVLEVKYKLSKCRSEVIAMMEAMAKDPKRFKFHSASAARYSLEDTVHKTMFQYYHFSKTNNYLYINGKQFLTESELDMLSSVINSLYIMSKNEYQLQKELKILEEQENVFELYQNEKLQT